MILRHLSRAVGVPALFAGLLTAAAGSASACQRPPGEQEPQRYAKASHVFTGVVVDEVREPLNYQYRNTLQVGPEYKGDVPDTVRVLTYDQVAACGLTSLVVGVDYLVFAYDHRSALRVSSRGGTRPAAYGPPVTETGTADSAATTAIPSPCDHAEP